MICTCDQHGDFCLIHLTCACGCQRHAHWQYTGACTGGLMRCHGCDAYRPAKLRRFEELCDDELEAISSVEALREAYRALRAHHVEETTALWDRIPASAVKYE